MLFPANPPPEMGSDVPLDLQEVRSIDQTSDVQILGSEPLSLVSNYQRGNRFNLPNLSKK